MPTIAADWHGMDKAFWDDRWARHDIGFHQQHVHELLTSLWPAIGLPRGSPVFVPLCGKSRDMVWLAEQGHRIVGAELSPIAIREFFEEQDVVSDKTADGRFEISSAGSFKLYCGDIFDLTAECLETVGAVYDRAALIALPADMRARYADFLKSILPSAAPIFLIAIDYPKDEIAGPPFAVSTLEIGRLFSDVFKIDILDSRDGLAASDNLKKRGVSRMEETAYRLRRRA